MLGVLFSKEIVFLVAAYQMVELQISFNGDNE